MLTVQEVWRRALPRGAELVAGAGALGRTITHPILMRPRMPAFPEPPGGTLALIPLAYLPLLEDQPSLERVVNELTRADVGALLVFGTPSERAIRLADELSLPLFTLAEEQDPREVETQISRAMGALKDELYQRGHELYRSLTELVIQQRGLEAMVERLAHLAGRPVALEDELPQLQHLVNAAGGAAPHPGPVLVEQQVRQALEAQAGELLAWSAAVRLSGSDPPTTTLVFPGERMARVVAPVVVPGVPGSMPIAWVSVFGRPRELGAADALVAARGAAACALELASQRRVSEAEERGRSDFLDELLAGTLAAEALQLRAERHHVRLDEPHIAIVLRAHGPGLSLGVQGRLHRAADAEATRLPDGALTAERPDHILTVARFDGSPESVRRDIDGLTGRVRERMRGFTLSAAVGRAYRGAAGIRRSAREAQEALAIGDALFGEGHLTHFADLGIYRLLFALPDPEELRALYDESLRELVERDEHGELLRTLEVYLSANGSATRAAEQLALHRNSLAYRLRRIEELTGASLEDAEQRLTFQVALRARAVLRARGLL